MPPTKAMLNARRLNRIPTDRRAPAPPQFGAVQFGAVQFAAVRKKKNLRPHAPYVDSGILGLAATAFESNEASRYEINKSRKRD